MARSVYILCQCKTCQTTFSKHLHTWVQQFASCLCCFLICSKISNALNSKCPYWRSSSEYWSCHKLIIVPEFWFKMCIWLICTDSLARGSAPRIKISSKTRFWEAWNCLDQNIKRRNIQPWDVLFMFDRNTFKS